MFLVYVHAFNFFVLLQSKNKKRKKKKKKAKKNRLLQQQQQKEQEEPAENIQVEYVYQLQLWIILCHCWEVQMKSILWWELITGVIYVFRYVQEQLELDPTDPNYFTFAKIFDAFKVSVM